MTIIKTEGTYWGGKGKHQELAKQLHPLIPSEGSCDDDAIDFFRVVSNLYYDLHNNGLCNANCKLPPVQDAMRQFKPQLRELMTQQQYDCVYGCWEEVSDNDDEYEGTMDYYPHYDSILGWFSEELELAFEALVDASIVIAAKSLGLINEVE